MNSRGPKSINNCAMVYIPQARQGQTQVMGARALFCILIFSLLTMLHGFHLVHPLRAPAQPRTPLFVPSMGLSTDATPRNETKLNRTMTKRLLDQITRNLVYIQTKGKELDKELFEEIEYHLLLLGNDL